MNGLEKSISLKFNAKDCIYTASGTSALYSCFRHLKDIGCKNILIPNIICPQVSCASIKAGLEPIFGDINLDNFTLSFDSVKESYERFGFKSLVLAHIYGHICDERIIDFCKEKSIFIVEDCAQTYKIDKNSDFAILSFGHTKFLQNEMGGGVVLSNKYLDKIRLINDTLTLRPSDYIKAFDEYRNRYYAIDKHKADYYNKIRELLLEYTLLYKESENEVLEEKLNRLDDICIARRKKAKIYQSELKHQFIINPKISNDTVPWRWTFRFIGQNRDEFLQKLRSKNIDCSSWYECNDKIFNGKCCDLKNSRIFEKQVVNLWLDESISESQIKQNIDIILKTI
ncbi:aminotransferase, DegT/DnrJ/EryC1/StrS family [Campylobacter iguaniorum]|uniref:DegT/DnrJ/EryC1/StrS family aminotransferase n=1 Tax=Campylobacter iguaniorum TaxID=1244531 RepID=UPI0007C8BA85|nr:DegT/DnrJ/EryC1/StrS family aminotransferase [Campylobacter iguaniorum]ANE36450.1 aminotransferase, DegT/DnrJ/EryC1/StrS family [Campylobacter iguaniorum]